MALILNPALLGPNLPFAIFTEHRIVCLRLYGKSFDFNVSRVFFVLLMFVTAVVSATALPVSNTDYTTVVVDSPVADNHVTVYILNGTYISVFGSFSLTL